MADLRKLLAHALRASDLSASSTEETNLDRLLALAHATRLGGLLWRLRLANDAAAFRPAALIIAKRMLRGPHDNPKVVERVASCALMEWLDDLCRPCRGRGYLAPKDTPVLTSVCTVCNGSGRAHYSDAVRAAGLGITLDAVRKWEPRFARAHSVIAGADRDTWLRVAIQLERVTGKAGTRAKVMLIAGEHGILGVEGEHSPSRESPGAQQHHHPGATIGRLAGPNNNTNGQRAISVKAGKHAEPRLAHRNRMTRLERV